MRETDGACSTVVCGFIQIYDGWKGRPVANGERVGETMGGKRGRLSVQDSESLWLRASQHSGVVV